MEFSQGSVFLVDNIWNKIFLTLLPVVGDGCNIFFNLSLVDNVIDFKTGTEDVAQFTLIQLIHES